MCPQQLEDIAREYGPEALRLARLGAVKAGGLLTLLLAPTPTFGELTLVQFEGANGADIEFRHQPGESQATLTAVDADGIEFRYFLVQSGGGFIVRAAQRTDGLGGLVDLSASQAMVIAGELFGQWNEGFTTPDLGIDLTTTIFPLPEQQGPLIFITQATDPRPFILSTPIADPLPTAMITTPPDVGWMDLWMSQPTVQDVYSPINPGPLDDDIAKTFRSSTYREVVLNEPTRLYRVIGDGGKELGGFWTLTKPQGPLQSVIDSALDQNWGNTATTVIEMEAPAGTRLFEGIAAQQRGLTGGGNQIYFDQNINPIDPKWIQR